MMQCKLKDLRTHVELASDLQPLAFAAVRAEPFSIPVQTVQRWEARRCARCLDTDRVRRQREDLQVLLAVGDDDIQLLRIVQHEVRGLHLQCGEVTRQQLELELQIPEKLSRRFVDQTIEFYVFITDQEGFAQIGELNRKYGSKPIALEDINSIKGDKERFELVPRGKGALETIIANRYLEIKVDEEVKIRADLLNTGTLEVEEAHLVILPPLGWTTATSPDTIAKILPGEKEPINIALFPPEGLGVSEYDVRVEATSGKRRSRPRRGMSPSASRPAPTSSATR